MEYKHNRRHHQAKHTGLLGVYPLMAVAMSVVGALLWMAQPNTAYAGCSIHDHNCFHGAYPNDPTLGNVPSGAATLEITTNYGGAPNVDLNQHVGLPPGTGPYVASNPDGNPVEGTPLGGGANVIFHNQQTVQYANGGAGGQLTSTQGTETTTMIGNVAEGNYSVGAYNYDINNTMADVSFGTAAVATGTGHFDGPSNSHIPTPFVQSISVGGGTLAANTGTSVGGFAYYNNGFNPHASGVYVIPDGVWNIGGIADSNFVSPTNPFQFEYANPNVSQDAAAIDFINHIIGESTQSGLEFGGWGYQGANGGQGFTLTVGDQYSVDILEPGMAIQGAGSNDPNAIWHTHVTPGSSQFSNQDLFVSGYFDVDSYLGSQSANGMTNISTINSDALLAVQASNGQTVVLVNTSQGIFAIANVGNHSNTLLEDSYIGGRDVGGAPAGQHGYTAIGANFPGDPNAEIVSYGPSNTDPTFGEMWSDDYGNLVPRSMPEDQADWDNQSVQDSDVQQLVDSDGKPISDEAVRNAHDDLQDALNDNPVAYGPFGPNSNSATVQPAIKAGAVDPDIPGIAPGSSDSIPGFDSSPPSAHPSAPGDYGDGNRGGNGDGDSPPGGSDGLGSGPH